MIEKRYDNAFIEEKKAESERDFEKDISLSHDIIRIPFHKIKFVQKNQNHNEDKHQKDKHLPQSLTLQNFQVKVFIEFFLESILEGMKEPLMMFPMFGSEVFIENSKGGFFCHTSNLKIQEERSRIFLNRGNLFSFRSMDPIPQVYSLTRDLGFKGFQGGFHFRGREERSIDSAFFIRIENSFSKI